MIVSGQLLLSDQRSEGSELKLVPGHLRLKGAQIAEVSPGQESARSDLGGDGCLICPGFIDAHLHLPQFDVVGAHGMPLLEWLDEIVFPAEAAWADPRVAAAATHQAIDQCFAHGTTAICAFASVHGAGTAAAMKVAADRRIRGLIGQVLMDRAAPAELMRPVDTQIEDTLDLLRRYRPGDRLAAAVTPRFAISCSERLLSAAGHIAKQAGAAIQTHLAETVTECEAVSQRFAGKEYAEVYESHGLLTDRTLCGHGIHLSAAEADRLAASGAAIVHCPTANTFLRSGTMDRAAHLRRGIPILLGSDIGAGFERSMIRVARAMIESASSLGPGFPNAAEAWWQITYGNATLLGWPDRRRFAPGCPADLLIIEPDIRWLSSDVDPFAKLLYAWDDRWLKQTIVQGDVVYQR